MKRLIALTALLVLSACASGTEPTDPKPSFEEQGGVPPNCLPGYHAEGQGWGGYGPPRCVANG